MTCEGRKSRQFSRGSACFCLQIHFEVLSKFRTRTPLCNLVAAASDPSSSDRKMSTPDSSLRSLSSEGYVVRACLPACLGGLVRPRVRGRAGGSVCVCNVSMSFVSL